MHDGADVLNDGIGHGLCFFEKSASTPIAVKKKRSFTMVGSLGHVRLFSSIRFILLGFVKGLAITISMPALRKGLKRISLFVIGLCGSLHSSV